MRIHLVLPNHAGQPVPVDVRPDEPIASIVARVVSYEGVSPSQQHTLEHNGMALSGLRTLDSYNIAAGATLTLSASSPSKQVFIKTLSGRTIVIDVEEDDNVATVKRKIQEREGIPAELQRLIFVGEQLDDRRRFLDYHIEYESAIHLVSSVGDSFQLLVDLPTRRLILEVRPPDTVASIKRAVQEKEGVPFDVQQLSFEGRGLSDSDTVGSCGITPRNNLIRVAIDEGRDTQIFVSIPGQERISLWVNATYTVGRIKRLIETRERIPVDTQRLYHARQLLTDDERSLAACGIEENHTVHLAIEDPLPVNLTVRKEDGRVLHLAVPSNEPVEGLRARVAALEGAAPRDVQLYHKGSALKDSTKLCHVPLAEGSTVDLILPPRTAPVSSTHPELLVFVRSLAGKVVPVQISPAHTVGELKERIEVQQGIPRANQCLVHGGCQLEDNRTVSESGLQNQSAVHLVVRVPRPLNLQVRALDGSRVQCAADPSRTVRWLLQSVGTEGIENVNVFLGEQQLRLERPLNSYQLAEGDIIQLQAKDELD